MDLGKSSLILLLVLVGEALLANFISPQRFPKIPGDVFIEKPGIRIYIPLISPFVITILVILTLHYLLK